MQQNTLRNLDSVAGREREKSFNNGKWQILSQTVEVTKLFKKFINVNLLI